MDKNDWSSIETPTCYAKARDARMHNSPDYHSREATRSPKSDRTRYWLEVAATVRDFGTLS